MPIKPLSPCTQPGCPALTRGGPCPTHRREREQRRGTSTQRGYDSKWRVIRAQFLKAHPYCECDACLATGARLRAIDVDHRDGDSSHNVWSNLRAMAHGHHSRRTARDQSGWGKQ